MIRENLASSKKTPDLPRCYVCVVKHAVAMMSPLEKNKFSSKDLNERVLEQSGHGLLQKYRRELNENVNVTSNNRGFRTNSHYIATDEQLGKAALLLPKTNNRE